MRLFALAPLVLLLASVAVAEDEYRVEKLAEPAPEEVAKPIADLLSPSGFKVLKGEKRTVCDLWLCAEWPVRKDFEPSAQVLYPFEPGQLIGVLRFPRKGSDFREQPIDKGVYTLRYALQPVDGSHVGTSPTRDFIVMVKAESDTSIKPIEAKALAKLSAEAAGSGHPAMLCLQKPEAAKTLPALRHNAEHEWWILSVAGTAAGAEKPQQLDLVVVGKFAE